MRVVAGKLRHRQINMTGLETTRETQDKVRQAIFNMIGPYFDGGKALDLFAGSGAMGIEAYSRGIDYISLNDHNIAALNVCKNNCKTLGINDVDFSNLDYLNYINNCTTKFDLIILDPPYKMNNINEILHDISSLVNDKGIVVFEMAIDSVYPSIIDNLTLIKDKTYGIKRVVIYKHNN